MDTKPNYYGIIPAEIRYNKKLTPNAKILYSEITALCNKEGFCWAGNKYFANLYNTSRTSISKWISSLEKQGYIRIEIIKDINGTRRKIYAGGVKKTFNPCKDSFHHNNTRDNILSKDNTDTEVSDVFKSPFTEKCITEWNDIPYTRSIRITTKTKTISKLEKYIYQLLNGKFAIKGNSKTFNTEWFFKNKIELFSLPKLTKKEIQVTLKRVALYSKDGYFTDDKYSLPKDLATLIYNPRTGKSWFIYAYFNKPKIHTIPDPDPETSNYIISVLKDHRINLSNIYHSVQAMNDFINNIPKKSIKVFKIRKEIGKPIKLAKEYVRWMKNQDWLGEITPNCFKVDSRLWKKFIEDKEEDYNGYKLWDKIH